MIITKGMTFPVNSGKNGLIIRGTDDIIVDAVGDIKFETLRVETPVRWGSGSSVHLGEMGGFSYFCNNSYIRNVEKIGRFVSISSDFIAGFPQHSLELITSSSYILSYSKKNWYAPFVQNDCYKDWIEANIAYYRKNERKKKGIIIGNDVWIGQGVTISDGVTIGDGAVIGTGAIVTKNVAPYSVVAGVPAREIRKRFSDDIIEQLLELRWWEYGPDILLGLNQDINIAVKELRKKIFAVKENWHPDIIEFSHENQEIYRVIENKKELLYKL